MYCAFKIIAANCGVCDFLLPRIGPPEGQERLTYRARRRIFQVSSPVSQYVSPNLCPFALNVSPCRCLHFSNSRGLFFSCSNADATASALGMPGSAATEKHVDSERGEITRTILASTRKCVP